jgi:Type I phosphodiesterase / nucleotide pyrophosphatase
LPTFIDFKDNLESDKIQEDNILYQIQLENKKSVFVGDMIWLSLLPDGFTKSYPYDSHNVRDLDTVDQGVLFHFREELREDWDLIIGHMLGVDHAGHRYYANHPEMTRKLLEMNDFITEIIDTMDNKTLLIVFGDHGMTDQGNHGGNTVNEMNTILFAYSPAPFAYNLSNRRTRVPQIDIVPTLSILLGVGIPYNNLGAVIPELINNTTAIQTCVYLNAKQINTYLNTYDNYIKKLPDTVYESLQSKFILLEKSYENKKFSVDEGLEYIYSAGSMCRGIWTTFDYFLMSKGCFVVAMGGIAGVFMVIFQVNFSNIIRNTVITVILAIISPIISSIYWLYYVLTSITSYTLSEEFWVVFGINAMHGYSLFSDSYILKEDQTLRFLLQLLLAYCWSKKYSHYLLISSICIRLSGSLDLIMINNEMSNQNILYNTWVLSYIPMMIFMYFLNWTSRISLILILWYWNVDNLNIQVLPKIVYAIFMLSVAFHAFIIVRYKDLASIGALAQSLVPLTLITNGPNGPIIVLCALVQAAACVKAIPDSKLLGTFIGMTGLQYFYTTGHRCNIQSLIIPSAFIGFDEFNIYISGALLTLNTLGSFFLCSWTFTNDSYEKSGKFTIIFYLVSILCTTLNTFINSRHLMVWSVFAPKYLFDVVIFITVWSLFLLMMIIKKQNIKIKD